MRISVLKLFVFTLVGFFFFLSTPAFAQLNNTDVTLTLSPENPTPGQEVKAALVSYVFDLNKSNITWMLNNQVVAVGIGRKNFTFNVGELGTQTTLNISIDTIDGQSIKKNINLTTSDIDMLWEAVDAYRPPFYKGKTLGGREGTFKVVAIPSIGTQNSRVSPNNLSYVWEKNDDGQPTASGWGKTSFTFKNSYLDLVDEIKVKASDITGKINTEAKINLQGVNSKILFYKNNPTLGINFENALSNGFTLSKDGEDLVAVPYFFSPKTLKNDNVEITWTLGNRVVQGNKKNELRIRPEEGKTGSSKIKVFITNTKSLFQEVEKEINVNF